LIFNPATRIETETHNVSRFMNNLHHCHSRLGRWAPIVFYAIIVLGWFAEGVLVGAYTRLWLVVWTLPVPAVYLWRTRWSSP
jgi:hypothetical protein